MTHRIGIMQGRLSPRPRDRIQAFPHGAWRAEFGQAKRLGFDYLEWIYELDAASANPIASATGRQEMRAAVAEAGLPIGSVCADYFMLRRLAGGDATERRKNAGRLSELAAFTREVGANRILLPLLETSAVDTPELRAQVVESLGRVSAALDEYGVTIGIEMEIAGEEYRALIDALGHPRVRAYYDTGNSTAQGHDIGEDVLPLLPVLEAVHVKDRVRGGGSVPLGTGNANFSRFFARLAAAGFAGDFVLQHFFDTDPIATARRSLEFVRGFLELPAGTA